MTGTHYVVYVETKEFSPEYYRIRALIDKFTMHFHICGSFYHLTQIGDPVPLDVLRDAVQGAIGPEGFCYVGLVADYYATPTLEGPQSI
jgi:hypothetical protein